MLVFPILLALIIFGSLLVITILSWVCVIRFDLDELGAFIATYLTVFGLLFVVLAIIPFNAKYWFITPTTGTISQVENKLVINDGDSTSLTGQFVVTLKGDKEAVILTDPRVQTYKVGDEINLNCSYGWVYGGLDKKFCDILG